MHLVVEDVDGVLVESPDAETRVAVHSAHAGLDVTSDELEQSRLPRAVGPHERDAAVAVNPKLEVAVQVVLRLKVSVETKSASAAGGTNFLIYI